MSDINARVTIVWSATESYTATLSYRGVSDTATPLIAKMIGDVNAVAAANTHASAAAGDVVVVVNSSVGGVAAPQVVGFASSADRDLIQDAQKTMVDTLDSWRKNPPA